MTAKRDLKRRVRARQDKTGESYAAARAQVVGQAERPAPPTTGSSGRPPVIPVIEMHSITREAAALGMKCKVTIASPLAAMVDPKVALRRVRDALEATSDDPGTGYLRSVVLDGERPAHAPRSTAGWLTETRRFVARARAGIGGISEGGTMLALHVEGKEGAVLMICHVGVRPFNAPHSVVPRLVLTSADSIGALVDLVLFR